MSYEQLKKVSFFAICRASIFAGRADLHPWDKILGQNYHDFPAVCEAVNLKNYWFIWQIKKVNTREP